MPKNFQILTQTKQPSPEVLELLTNQATTSRYPTITHYLKKQKIKYNPKELEFLQKTVQKNFFKQVHFLCHLLYYIMDQSQDWGPAGADQAKVAFCRNLLNIPPENNVSPDQFQEFENKIKNNLIKHGFQNMTIETANSTLNNFQFKLLGRLYPAETGNFINPILKFLGLKWHLLCGKTNEQRNYILLEGRKIHLSGYDIMLVEKEILRTPNVIMALAAVIGDRAIYIRKESLKTVFQQKWLQVFRNTDFDKQFIKSDIYHNISEGIKKKALSLYKAKDEESLDKVKTLFLKDMQETIIYHELGHGAIFHDILDMEKSAITESTGVFGTSVISTLMEILADLAPSWEKLKGPYQNMIDISKTNKNRATRMFYIYLSDVWFFDTQDEYMYLYSELIVIILLKYIKPNLSIDFAKMEKDLTFTKNPKLKDKKENLIYFLEEIIEKCAEDIKQMVLSAKYKVPSGEKEFEYIKALTYNNLKKHKITIDETSYRFHSAFWNAFLNYANQLSDKSQDIQNYLNNQNQVIIEQLMTFLYGRSQSEKYQFNMRNYIKDKMQELKILGEK